MGRLYETTHPWIKFELDLTKADYQLWLLLGECKSKIEHIAGVPPSPELSKKMHAVYLAKGVHATTAIEGNTLSESQVQQAIDGVLRSTPSQEYLAQEVRNIIQACNYIGGLVFNGKELVLTTRLVSYFNKRVRHKLPGKPDCNCISGSVSEHSVTVGNIYKGAPREDCDYLINRLCSWLNEMDEESTRLDPVILGLIKAVLAHLYIVWIHPFCDGNGRTARLTELLILLNAGAPSPVGHLLSNHYNITRDEYYTQLIHTSRSDGNIIPFLKYAMQGLRDQLAEQIEWVREQQIDQAWFQFIGKAFPSPAQAKHKRQRELVEALGKQSFPLSELFLVSPAVARDYARVSGSTQRRDISELLNLKLIVLDTTNMVRANREQILSLMPSRKTIGRSAEKEDIGVKTRKRGRPSRKPN
jgi:Fic family protein